MTVHFPEKDLQRLAVAKDGHCIINAVRAGMMYPQTVPQKDELLNGVKKELTVNIEYYSKFINSEEVDFVDEIERYTAMREYSTATTDLVLHAVSEVLECRIVIYHYHHLSRSYRLENASHCINPVRQPNLVPQFTVYLLKEQGHYDGLIKHQGNTSAGN